jgi:hypothetical protein
MSIDYRPKAPLPNLDGKPPVGRSADLDRVLAIPRRPLPTETDYVNLVSYMTAHLARPSAGGCRCASMKRECITTLRPIQAWTLYEAMMYGGVFGIIAVGAGKTFLNLLTPLVVRDCKKALLLVPSNLMTQLVGDYHLLSQHFRVPSIVVHNGSGAESWTVPGTPAVHVFPYSRLSRPESTAFVNQLAPDLIIVDEGDKLANIDSAGTSRVDRRMTQAPDTRFCVWSGSITDKSLKDYAHLIAWALKRNAPLPIDDTRALTEWADAIDAVDWRRPPGQLAIGLQRAGFMTGLEDVREGFRRRMHETPGVVYSSEQSLPDVEMVLTEREAPPVPREVEYALDYVREWWVRPDGEDLITALEVNKCCLELACGFFYRWIYPRGEPEPLVKEWREARSAWRRQLREKLKKREDHLDSEKLCQEAAMRAWGDVPIKVTEQHLPVWKASEWPRWRDVAKKVAPKTDAIRISDYLARDAAQWAHTHRGVVWYDTTEFGKWVSEIAELPMYGGGKKGGGLIRGDGTLIEAGERSIIVSLNSHGRGRNGFQFGFDDQLITEPPSSSKIWEQLLGRIHRPGQKSNVVRASYYAHTAELAKAYEQATTRAHYVAGTMGTHQKLLTATRAVR